MAVERTGFQIDMTADATGVVKGAGEGAAALESVAAKTKDLSGALGEGKEKLDEHGKGLEDTGHAGEKGEEGLKLFGKGAHEAHAALRVLNDALPGVEGMARFLSNRLTVEMGVQNS